MDTERITEVVRDRRAGTVWRDRAQALANDVREVSRDDLATAADADRPAQHLALRRARHDECALRRTSRRRAPSPAPSLRPRALGTTPTPVVIGRPGVGPRDGQADREWPPGSRMARLRNGVGGDQDERWTIRQRVPPVREVVRRHVRRDRTLDGGVEVDAEQREAETRRVSELADVQVDRDDVLAVARPDSALEPCPEPTGVRSTDRGRPHLRGASAVSSAPPSPVSGFESASTVSTIADSDGSVV